MTRLDRVPQHIAVYWRGFTRGMGTTKTATLTFRIDPGLKDALRAATQQEHRPIANMVAVLIRDYCERHGIAAAGPKDIEIMARNTQHD